MLVDYALSFIKKELKFIAKQEIISKYSIIDSQITDDYEYYEDGKLKFRHIFSAITDEIILENLYANMLHICTSYTPINLLIQKGKSSENIIRNLNDDYDIRKPNELILGEEMDIDEPLALASVYDTLNFFGATAFSSKAKNILTEYERNLVIPNAKYISDLAFRFSKDGNSWHSDYENGDNYFGIYKNGSWGNAIPLISGNGGGIKTLTALLDFPKTHESGKYLRSNGSKLEWVDIEIPNNTQTTTTIISENTSEPSVIENYTTLNGIDLNDSDFFVLKIENNVEFNINTAMENIKTYKEFRFIVLADFNDFSFSSDIALTERIDREISGKMVIMFNLMKISDTQIIAYNLNTI